MKETKTIFLLIICPLISVIMCFIMNDIIDEEIKNTKFTDNDKKIESIAQIDTNSSKIDSSATTTSKMVLVGVASWYDYTIQGYEWSNDHLTCASRDFKRYSTIKITNLDNGNSINCYVNDYVENKDVIIDLSSYAFSKLAPLKLGLINIKAEEL